MPSEVIDFAKLLAPISVEKPTGVDPRSDISHTSPYQRIRDARRNARNAEKQSAAGAEGAATEPADWKKVRQIAVEVLTTQAKDLEITAYLIEGLLRLEGFAGLRDGFRLAGELVEKYWDTLYPLPDEDGLVARTAPLTGLNGEDNDGTLIDPIARVVLTDKTSVGQFDQVNYIEANALKKIADPKALQKKLDGGAVSLETFKKAVAETPAAFYHKLLDELNGCLAEFGKLGEALDKRCAGEGPPTSRIRDALSDCLNTIKTEAADKLRVSPPAAPAKSAPAPGGGQAGVPAPAPNPGVLQSREQALESLQKVADFFRRTEPHSPVSYALEQVMRWASMPLPELWTELIADEAPRKNVFKQVGIRPTEEVAKGKK